MIQDVNKAIKLVEEQLLKINQVDNAMSTIYNTFAIKNNKEKEDCLNEYNNLLQKRNELVEPIIDVQTYLSQVIENLNKVKLNFYDKYTYKKRINSMKKQVEESVEFYEEDPISSVVRQEVKPEPKVEVEKKK
jgi:predicted GTPase